MFDAPLIYKQIPDLNIIYGFNDLQAQDFDTAFKAVDDSIFLDRMGEYTIGRWEKILDIIPTTTDTVESRRFRVKTKLMERLPYTYRVIMARLAALFPDGFEVEMNEERTEFALYINPAFSGMIPAAYDMLEMMLPLNMTLLVSARGKDIETTIHMGGAVVLAQTYTMDGSPNRKINTPTVIHSGMAISTNFKTEV